MKRPVEPDVGLRENLNKKPAYAVAITVIVILGALVFIFWQTRPETPGEIETRVFYTDDDGKTWFPEQANHVPPFNHNGKDAVRCFVYKNNGQPFVAYMRKFTKPVAAKISGNQSMGDAELANGTLVKRPSDPDWIPSSDPRAAAIMNPKNPKNPGEPLTAVMP
jgi:hypothetical protein